MTSFGTRAGGLLLRAALPKARRAGAPRCPFSQPLPTQPADSKSSHGYRHSPSPESLRPSPSLSQGLSHTTDFLKTSRRSTHPKHAAAGRGVPRTSCPVAPRPAPVAAGLGLRRPLPGTSRPSAGSDRQQSMLWLLPSGPGGLGLQRSPSQEPPAPTQAVASFTPHQSTPQPLPCMTRPMGRLGSTGAPLKRTPLLGASPARQRVRCGHSPSPRQSA